MSTPISANAQGVITGKFHIPAKKIKAGTKPVNFLGDMKGHAETTFTGQGTVVTNTMRTVHNIQQSYYDPLAQTFMLTKPRQLCGVDIWLAVKGNTPLIVQLRETSVGFPTRTIIAEGRIEQDSTLTVGNWVRVNFDTPFYASANIEYAVVVLANDSQTEVGISALGKPDLAQGGYVTQQPYQVGVLLSSANASTWTAHQDKDLTFRLYARKYNPANPKSIILGEINLAPGTTDLLISALTSTPTTGADASLVLYQMSTDPQFANDINKAISSRDVSDGQVVKFNQPTSGRFTVVANLRCTDVASATIDPGTQIIQGIQSDKATYVSRNIPVGVKKTGTYTITITLGQISGTKVEAQWAWVPQQGDVKDTDYKTVTPVIGDPDINGMREIVFKQDGIALTGLPQQFIKVRLNIEGTAQARIQVVNLRVSVV